MAEASQTKKYKLYDNLKDAFMKAGLSYWDAIETVRLLDEQTYRTIAEDLVTKLDVEKNLELFVFLKEKPSKEILMKSFGVTSDEIDNLHNRRLEECLASISTILSHATNVP